MLKKISATIHAYDPYGFMQRNGCYSNTCFICKVNFCFAPFVLSGFVPIIIGIFTTALEKNF